MGRGTYGGVMIDERDIREFSRIGEKDGKRFNVLVWQPRHGNPFVRAIRFEDSHVKNLEFPLFGGQFTTEDDAFDAAFDLALSLL